MDSIALLISSVVFLGVCIYLLVRVRNLHDELRRCEKERADDEEILKHSSGLEEYHEQRRQEKEARKQTILDLLEQKGSIKNTDVVAAIDVSSATATRYLDELEEEGKIEQKGRAGRFVVYTHV